MNPISETIFRIVFGALWLLYFAVRLYFQRKVKGAVSGYVLKSEKQEMLYFRLFTIAYLLAPYFLTSRIPNP